MDNETQKKIYESIIADILLTKTFQNFPNMSYYLATFQLLRQISYVFSETSYWISSHFSCFPFRFYTNSYKILHWKTYLNHSQVTF